jgi:hypothetical protein
VIEALVLELLVALVRQNRLEKPISPGWIKRIRELIQSDPTAAPSLQDLSGLRISPRVRSAFIPGVYWNDNW